MRPSNEAIVSAGDMSANINSSATLIEWVFGYSIQVVMSGAPVGSLKLQASNDFDAGRPMAAPVNWTDIALTTQAVNGAGTAFYNIPDSMYRWVRLVYTFTSGTGSMTARIQTKGA